MVCRFFDPAISGDQHLRVAVELLKRPCNTRTHAPLARQAEPMKLDEAISLYAAADADPRKLIFVMRNKGLAHLSTHQQYPQDLP